MGKPLTDENRLSKTYPELLKEWNYKKNKITPDDISHGSDKKVWWICGKGHEWQSGVNDKKGNFIKNKENGCPYCHGNKTHKSLSLGVLYPEISKDWDFKRNKKLTPFDVRPGSDRKVWWICSRDRCRNQTKERVFKRIRRKSCNRCKTLRVMIPEIFVEIHKTKNKFDINKISWKSGKKALWKCLKCKCEWKATVANRSNGECNCPNCNNICLKNGMVFKSIPEEYVYIQFKKLNYDVEHNKRYPGLKRKRYDFYSAKDNLYIEVSSFNDRWRFWNEYINKIEEKRIYVEKTLKAKFLFIHLDITSKDRIDVKKHQKKKK